MDRAAKPEALRREAEVVSETDLLWLIYEWLPRVFLLDVLVFHLVAEHPFAARCWQPGRSLAGRSAVNARARSDHKFAEPFSAAPGKSTCAAWM